MSDPRYYLTEKVEHSCCYGVALVDSESTGPGSSWAAEFTSEELAQKVCDLLNGEDEEKDDRFRMLPVTVNFYGSEGEHEIATMMPGIPPKGTAWFFEDKDRGIKILGRVEDVVIAEEEGDITITIDVEGK